MDIKKYNCALVEHECAYTLWQYILKIMPQYFPEYQITTILKFITLNYKENHTIIDNRYLKRYNLKKDPKEYVYIYKLKYNIHYIILKDNEYMFTPETFKQLILEDKNNIYKDYFMVIEKCMFYYMDYQYRSEKKIEMIIEEI